MKRHIVLAMAALAAFVMSCKDSIAPPEPIQTSISMVIGADTNYVLLTANQPAMWQLCYGAGSACTDTVPPQDRYGPAKTFSPTLRNLKPGTAYYCKATAWGQGVSVSIRCDFVTPSVTLAISPKTATAYIGDTIRFTASFSRPLANPSVDWSATGGTIDQNGRLTGLTTTGTITVKVCSEAYASLCDSALVMVRIPGLTGLIAFSRHEQLANINCRGAFGWIACLDIFVLNADSMSVRQLTGLTPSYPAWQNWSPAWSHDGRRLAFTGTVAVPNQGFQIFVISSNGGNLVQLTSGSIWPTGIQGGYPNWSPNDSLIVFSYIKDSHESGLATMDTLGRNVTLITQSPIRDTFGDRWPAFSPDGQWILFERDGDIYKMHPDGTGLVNLTNTSSVGDFWPAWSPDGTKIAWTLRQPNSESPAGLIWQVYVMNADGTGKRQVTFGPSPNGYGGPTWSPDGQRLIVASIGQMVDNTVTIFGDLYLVNADGSGSLVNITNTSNLHEIDPAWRR